MSGNLGLKMTFRRGDVECQCSAPMWWNCSERGCRKAALERYGEQVSRFEPRDDHNQDTQGRKLRQGK